VLISCDDRDYWCLIIGIACRKSALVHNCWRALTHYDCERIELRNYRQRSGLICYRCRLMAKTRDGLLSFVLRGLISLNGEASECLRALELSGWKCPIDGEQLLECLRSGRGF